MDGFSTILIIIFVSFLLLVIVVACTSDSGHGRHAKIIITDKETGNVIITASGIGYGGAVISLASKEYERTKNSTNLEKLIFARDTLKGAMDTYKAYMRKSDYNEAAEYLRKIQERVDERQKVEDEYQEYCKVRGINPNVTRAFKEHERSKMNASIRYDVLKRDGFRCTLCGATAADGAKLVVDHIVPIAKGGKTEMSNLRTLCDRCNLGKSDKVE